MSARRILPRLALLLLLAAAAAWTVSHRDQINLAPLDAWLRSFGLWAPIGYVVLYVLATVAFAPGAVFGLPGGALEARAADNAAETILAMKVLFILNDPPYGTERSYNALRLANALADADTAIEITIFLTADAVACAKKGQKTPEGSRNLERMLRRFVGGNHQLLVLGQCMDARGQSGAELIDGARCSSTDALTAATAQAEKVLVF